MSKSSKSRNNRDEIFKVVNDKGKVLGEFNTRQEANDFVSDYYPHNAWYQPELKDVVVEAYAPNSPAALFYDQLSRQARMPTASDLQISYKVPHYSPDKVNDTVSDVEMERYLHNLEKSGFNFDYADRVLKADRHASQYNPANFLQGTGIGFLDPITVLRAGYDTSTGKVDENGNPINFFQSVIEGNSGLVPDDVMENNPALGTAINMIGSGATIMLGNKVLNLTRPLVQQGYNTARDFLWLTKTYNNVGRKIRTTPLGEVPTLTPSIESYNVNQYLTNGQWNLPKIKEDMLAGKQDFIEWIESPEYRIAAEANKKEAEAMGLKYVPTYEYPAYSDIKSKGAPVTFTIQPENNAMGWVATNQNSPITINLAKAKNIRSVMAHETAHKARHGWVDPNYSNFDIKKQQAYLRYKNSQVFQDDRADLTKEAGNMFYDFSSTGFPHEAVTNSRDLGKYYGIKVGQEYPGPEKTLELLNKMEREANTGFQKKFVQAFRKDPEHLKYVWKALNGTQWAITPLALGVTALNFNKTQEDEKD